MIKLTYFCQFFGKDNPWALEISLIILLIKFGHERTDSMKLFPQKESLAWRIISKLYKKIGQYFNF